MVAVAVVAATLCGSGRGAGLLRHPRVVEQARQPRHELADALVARGEGRADLAEQSCVCDRLSQGVATVGSRALSVRGGLAQARIDGQEVGLCRGRGLLLRLPRMQCQAATVPRTNESGSAADVCNGAGERGK